MAGRACAAHEHHTRCIISWALACAPPPCFRPCAFSRGCIIFPSCRAVFFVLPTVPNTTRQSIHVCNLCRCHAFLLPATPNINRVERLQRCVVYDHHTRCVRWFALHDRPHVMCSTSMGAASSAPPSLRGMTEPAELVRDTN